MFGVRQLKRPGVTVEEIRVMLEQGAVEGVFAPAEHEMVTNVLDLDDRHVGTVITPLVIDEFRAVEGLVSLTDVISSIVGDLPTEPASAGLSVVAMKAFNPTRYASLSWANPLPEGDPQNCAMVAGRPLADH